METLDQTVQLKQTEESTKPWVLLTDEMIEQVGYKSSKCNKSLNRCSLFRYIKIHFKLEEDYRITQIRAERHGRGGAQYKNILEMTQTAYDELLIRTHSIRLPKTSGLCFLYVMHNPMFLYYGPNVYKVGFSRDPSRRKNDDSTFFLKNQVFFITNKLHLEVMKNNCISFSYNIE